MIRLTVKQKKVRLSAATSHRSQLNTSVNDYKCHAPEIDIEFQI